MKFTRRRSGCLNNPVVGILPTTRRLLPPALLALLIVTSPWPPAGGRAQEPAPPQNAAAGGEPRKPAGKQAGQGAGQQAGKPAGKQAGQGAGQGANAEASRGPAEEWAEAERLRRRGRLAEALKQTRGQDAPQARLIAFRCQWAQGDWDAAFADLKQAIRRQPDQPQLHAELAWAHLKRGQFAQAETALEAAAGHSTNAPATESPNTGASATGAPATGASATGASATGAWETPQVLWLRAELARARGRLGEAEAGYRRLADLYRRSRREFTAEELCWIARGAAQYARWTGRSHWFRTLVTEILPAATEAEADYWPAQVLLAELFAEKFNRPAADRALDAALAINPLAAEAYAVRAQLALQTFDLRRARRQAEQALRLSPRLAAAHAALADVLLAEHRADEAVTALERAIERTHASDPLLVGRLAAAQLAAAGVQRELDDGPLPLPAAARAAVERIEAQNPRCGQLYQVMGEAFELQRNYPLAARCYRQSRDKLPQMPAAAASLGLVAMRLGNETEAAELLKDAAQADPFHVRVHNMLQVLDVLDKYAVLETEHFVLRFDRGQDQLLAELAAEYLEQEVYPEVVAALRYRPRGKTLIEFFSRTANTSGHGWFSARMVGLPYIGTVGACAGKMIALTSPNDGQKFHWGRVLRHEFVHVVNLQQTRFQIPHWFTEALAVTHEDAPRPDQWDRILRSRLERDALFDLSNINQAFVRPQNSEDWTLAYCQSELYARFIRTRFGGEAIHRLLEHYGRGRSTPEALRECLGREVADFEREYRQYLADYLDARGDPAAESNQLKAEIRQLLVGGDQRELLPKLERLAELDEQQVTVRKKIAQLLGERGKPLAAAKWLREILFVELHDPVAHAMLGEAYASAAKLPAARRHYRIATRLRPQETAWQLERARLEIRSGNPAAAADALRELLQREPANAAAAELLQSLPAKPLEPTN